MHLITPLCTPKDTCHTFCCCFKLICCLPMTFKNVLCLATSMWFGHNSLATTYKNIQCLATSTLNGPKRALDTPNPSMQTQGYLQYFYCCSKSIRCLSMIFINILCLATSMWHGLNSLATTYKSILCLATSM